MSEMGMMAIASQRLVWDKIGERYYQTGIDRGVLYLSDGTAVPWNGLTSAEIGSVADLKQFYLDGTKRLQVLTPGDFSGKLRAFTYPAEFDAILGIGKTAGLSFYEQPPKTFSLSYRTRIGNDVDGIDHGYKIHILYDLLAVPDASVFETLSDSTKPVEFAWSLTGTPAKTVGRRPTVHISIDSTEAAPETLEILENILYGGVSAPRLPTLDEVANLFGAVGSLVIVDNGDGTWTAIDSSNDYITMLDDTTFQIDNADATFLDVSTYEISTTNPA